MAEKGKGILVIGITHPVETRHISWFKKKCSGGWLASVFLVAGVMLYPAQACAEPGAMTARTENSAIAGIPFPGPALLPASVRISGEQYVIGNNALTATFHKTEGTLRLVKLQSQLNGLDQAWNDPNLFTIYLTGNAKPIASSSMQLVSQPEERVLAGTPGAARLSKRLPGRSLRARFSDEVAGLEVEWNAIMTDNANYLRQQITLKATREPLSVDRIEMIHAQLPAATVAGYTDGAPIITDTLFLGLEHPMSKNSADASSLVTCSLPRQSTLEKGMEWTVATGIGAYPAGQMRRAFLYYLERERAHPYRQYWHYNSWYDLNITCNNNPDPMKRMNEAQCLEVIRAFGSELYEKRGVGLDGFVWDDGWDDWNSLWNFHKGFPNGFAKLKEEALKQGSGMGAWLSPWGGYGSSKLMRVKFAEQKGYEIAGGGFSLGGPKYYAAYRDVCLNMIRDYNQNYFKFDGIGGGTMATGASARIAPDLDNLVRLLGELRSANPEIFINCTVGTWASPYWIFFADSIWRQGEDCSFKGKGNPREQWITYKDSMVHDRFASKSPLFPVNSLMYHGVLLGPTAAPGRMAPPAKDPDSLRHEIRMAAGYSSGLGELYITPALMTPESWDDLAECMRWSRSKQAVMVDSHWIGGDPLRNEIYGFAAWHPKHGGVITLRNPDDKLQTISLMLSDAFELPAGAGTAYELRSPWKSDAQKPPIKADAKTPVALSLQPFEVITLETQKH